MAAFPTTPGSEAPHIQIFLKGSELEGSKICWHNLWRESLLVMDLEWFSIRAPRDDPRSFFVFTWLVEESVQFDRETEKSIKASNMSNHKFRIDELQHVVDEANKTTREKILHRGWETFISCCFVHGGGLSGGVSHHRCNQLSSEKILEW